ncbi:VWA domain-containing protein [Paenibacillus sp. BAC0078]
MVSDKVDDSTRSGIFRRKSGGPMKNPIYVAFFTDGDNQDKAATTKLITELSGRGIFFQFIGIGNQAFDYLKKLDDLQNRILDNAGFFAARDVEGQDDTVMYRKMIKEFAAWIPQARAKGFIV